MSYTRKVIYISLGLLVAVTLLGFLSQLASGTGRVDGLEVGVIALGFSFLEAFVLIIAALGILIIKPGDGVMKVSSPDDLLDASGKREKPLTHHRRAGAFFAAAGIVILVGGSLCFGSLAV